MVGGAEVSSWWQRSNRCEEEQHTQHWCVSSPHIDKPQQHWLHSQPPSDHELTRVTGASLCGAQCVIWWWYRTFSTPSSTLSPGFSGWVHPAETWRHKDWERLDRFRCYTSVQCSWTQVHCCALEPDVEVTACKHTVMGPRSSSLLTSSGSTSFSWLIKFSFLLLQIIWQIFCCPHDSGAKNVGAALDLQRLSEGLKLLPRW